MTVLKHGKLLSADDYANAYQGHDGFEAVCIEARQQNNVAFLRSHRPDTILEIGCGPSLLSAMPGLAELGFRQWTIVEPARRYAEAACAALAGDKRFTVVQDYAEACGATLAQLAPGGYDMAIVSGLVHETTNPVGLLTAVSQHLQPSGKIIVSSPNALSFHRLLAVECGMIASPHELSELDLKLGHPSVYDPDSLQALVQQAGFTALQGGGSLFKLFTNAQMETVLHQLAPQLAAGLISLGQQFPRHAAEIFVTGEKI